MPIQRHPFFGSPTAIEEPASKRELKDALAHTAGAMYILRALRGLRNPVGIQRPRYEDVGSVAESVMVLWTE